eukprot:11053-Prorocentrum_minimum.AAC.1
MLAGNIFGVVLAEPNNGVGSAEWQYLAMLWVVCLAIRAAIVTLFYPVLDVLGSVNLFVVIPGHVVGGVPPGVSAPASSRLNIPSLLLDL